MQEAVTGAGPPPVGHHRERYNGAIPRSKMGGLKAPHGEENKDPKQFAIELKKLEEDGIFPLKKVTIFFNLWTKIICAH